MKNKVCTAAPLGNVLFLSTGGEAQKSTRNKNQWGNLDEVKLHFLTPTQMELLVEEKTTEKLRYQIKVVLKH